MKSSISGFIKILLSTIICQIIYIVFTKNNLDIIVTCFTCWLISSLSIYLFSLIECKVLQQPFERKFVKYFDKSLISFYLSFLISITCNNFTIVSFNIIQLVINFVVSIINYYVLNTEDKKEIEKEDNNKIEWVSIYKGILIIMMVIGHTRTVYNQFIYNFHMSAFFIISGYLFKINKVSFVDYFLKKVKALMKPFLIGSLILFAIAFFLSRMGTYFYNNPLTFESLFVFLRDFNLIDLTGAFWFIPILFFTSLIFKLITDILKNKNYSNFKISIVMVVITFILALWGYTYYNVHQSMSYQFDLVYMSLFMFSLGFLIKNIDDKLKHRYDIIIILFSTCCFILFNSFFYSRIDWPIRLFPDIIKLSLISISGFYIISYISKKICSINHNFKILKYIGNNTLPILQYHFLGFRVVFLILYYINYVSVEQLANLTPIYSGNFLNVITAIFAIVFSLFLNYILKFIGGFIYDKRKYFLHNS